MEAVRLLSVSIWMHLGSRDLEKHVQAMVRTVFRLLDAPWRRMSETVSAVPVEGAHVML